MERGGGPQLTFEPKADAILVIRWSLKITSICCCWIYKYNDVSQTETNTQVDSWVQGVLFIYVQLCRCNISLWKCNVSRQEASRHVLSTSLSLPYSLSLPASPFFAPFSPTNTPSCFPTKSISPSTDAAVLQDDSTLHIYSPAQRQIWASCLHANIVFAT